MMINKYQLRSKVNVIVSIYGDVDCCKMSLAVPMKGIITEISFYDDDEDKLVFHYGVTIDAIDAEGCEHTITHFVDEDKISIGRLKPIEQP